MATAARSKKPVSSQRDGAHPLEWLIGAVSGALIMALVFYLGYRGIAANGQPPQFAATVESIRRAGNDFHVRIAVTNSGGKTAADVRIQGVLAAPGGEMHEIVFDYLPAGSTRNGTLVFRNDPAEGNGLQLSVLAYGDP